jgi:predicted transcriptional regulator
MLDKQDHETASDRAEPAAEEAAGTGLAEAARPGRNFLAVNPDRQFDVVRGLASPVRIKILRLLRRNGSLNVNQIAEMLGLPQSTIATNIQILEDAELIATEIIKASKGQQKICSARFDEIIIRLDGEESNRKKNIIDVEMPLGLYTSCDVSAPCGMCSGESIIGMLDVPDLFLDPSRVHAALIWFDRGYVEYKFPNNAKVLKAEVAELEFLLELSSEVPGTNVEWPSDITLWVNNVKIGTWTSPGDYGDRRGTHTPRWWKMEGSQYGILTRWRITSAGTFLDQRKLSDVKLADLALPEHHSIRLRIGVEDHAVHPGGINIFGKGFGDYDQNILMRLHLKQLV